MTYEELIKKVKKEFESADVSNYEDHLALQFNATGEGAGIFYIEINDGKLYIAPFDYKDNNAVITADSKTVAGVFAGDFAMSEALESGKLVVEGDLAKAVSIQPYIKLKASKKKAVSKKKEDTAKTAAKADEKNEPKITLSEDVKKTVKTAAVKAPAVKDTATSAKKTAQTASKAAAKAVKETAVKTKTPAKKNKTGNSKG